MATGDGEERVFILYSKEILITLPNMTTEFPAKQMKISFRFVLFCFFFFENFLIGSLFCL